MITYEITDQYLDSNGETINKIAGSCLSSDTKPTNVVNGSTMIEMDTSKVYMFDATGKQWLAFE